MELLRLAAVISLVCLISQHIEAAGIATKTSRIDEMIRIEEVFEVPELKEDEKKKQLQYIEISTANENENIEMNVGEVKEFEFTLKFFDKQFRLSMQENAVMLKRGVKLVTFADNGTRVESDARDNCRYYQGRIIDREESTAALSICEDEMEGVVLTNDQRFMVKPVANTKNKDGAGGMGRNGAVGIERNVGVKTKGTVNRTDEATERHKKRLLLLGPHVVILEPAIRAINNKYGFVRIPASNSTHLNQRMRRNSLHLSETKYVELYIVNDRSEFLWLGSNTANNMRRMKQITNLMDSFYKPHNIRIVFTTLEVWTASDKIAVSNNIQNTLTSFLNYKLNTILPLTSHDNAQLVSRIDFTGPTIGLAPLNGMCRAEHSGSVNQDTHNGFANVAATMTHEMGHNFGMDHDGAGCVCHGNNGVCLMSPYAQNPITMKFSACSVTYLETYLKQELGGCLMNKPETGHYYDVNLCGNNKIDPGEDCDCGYPGFCQNPCCDASTCRFTTGSECATGKCCSGCRLLTAGTTCRQTQDPCDIVEICDGVNGECKENLYRPNGHPCSEHAETGYCYDGYCRTLAGQCKRVWGVASTRGDHACYLVLNVRGDQYGNCGTSGNHYVTCNTADVNCGKMFCDNMPQSSFPIIGYNKARSSVSFTINGRVVYCKSGQAKLGHDQPNPRKYPD
eukprot:gene9162-10135_t